MDTPLKSLSLLALVSLAFTGCRPEAPEVPAPAVPTEAAVADLPAAPFVVASSPVEAGRYLAIVGGCNDCHTHGYLQTEGQVPEADWLTGSPVGWRGPWGTTYPANLRLTADVMTEDAFVTTLHTRKVLPPMPWMNTAQMSEADARAIYRYLRHLGPKGERMPPPVPPGVEPTTPYLDLTPQNVEALAAAPPKG